MAKKAKPPRNMKVARRNVKYPLVVAQNL